MKLYRYMSNNEFQLLTSGMTLVNNNHFKNAKTNSNGFCFLGENIISSSGNTYTPQQAYSFLSGIVTPDVLVEFEIDDPTILTNGYGVYAEPMGYWGDCMTIPEYSINEYNIDIIHPLRYCVDFDVPFQKNKWYVLHY